MRVIALVDMDCFYCQVEEKFNPCLRGKPVAVVQYNLWREGGIIAANYQAKAKGVHKGMWMHEAKNVCPEIEFARVAELRGRADLTKYREAGNQVTSVLSTFVNVLERASVDEAYLDLTESVRMELAKGISNIPLQNLKTTYIVGCTTSDFISNITMNQDTDGFCEDDLKLAIGGIIVEKIRTAVLEKTGYECSAGIAHNKILAKLVCGLNKPNKQTILPQNAISQYFAELPLKKIRRLGGKFGKKVAEKLKIQYVGELLNYSEKDLINKFDMKTGHWLHSIARGIDHEPVSPKLICKSISCCKRFPGKNALFKYKDIEHWTHELCLEISERLHSDQEENNRKARIITISFIQEINKNDVSSSKTIPLKTYDANKIAFAALEVIKNSCGKPNNSYHVKYLGISAGNFDALKNTKNIKYYLALGSQASSKKDVISERLITKIDVKEKENEANHELAMKQESDIRNNDEGEPTSSETKSNSCFEISQEYKKTSLQNLHEAKSRNHTIDAHTLSVTSCINIDKFSCLEKVQNDNPLTSKHLAEINDSLVEFNGNNDSGISKISIGSMIDNGDITDNSFFSRYFENSESNNLEIIHNPCEKSRMELSFTTEKDCNVYEESDEQTENSSAIDEPYAKCEECNQNILITEMNSHRDYHFALNMHKEELLTNIHTLSPNNISESVANDRITKKRKAGKHSTQLDVFLKKTQLDSTVLTETCSECDKKVRSTEWEYHSDYHAARKLYKDLNCKNNSSNLNKIKSSKSLGNDISRYLKRKSS